ncbi:hypothetical protein [Dictyobacter vulcani]|nr:hypothetical protein [Dictyobacter vulcani]
MITPGVVPGSLLNNQAGGGVTSNYYYPQQQMYAPAAQALPSFTPPAPPNAYARFSVICGIISILWPIFLCSNISHAFASNVSTTILFYLALLMPSLLGVICGLKGQKFAKQRKLKTATATTGLTLSAIFTSIYIVIGFLFLTYYILRLTS